MTTPIFDWVVFKGRSPHGERRRGTLEQFVGFVTTRHTAHAKELAHGFSPTAYKPEYTHVPAEGKPFVVTAPAVWRSNAGVESLSAFVADIDHAEPDWNRIADTGNLVIAYRTWSHSADDPHARLVVPMAGGVAAAEWPSAFELGIERFAPSADRSCGDVSRFYWLASAPPRELDRIQIRVIDGEPWAPTGLTVAPPATSTFSLRPVDANREATSEEQSAARRMLDATCRKLAQHPAGGRQVATYGHARHVGHLVAAGAIDEEEALEELWHAVVSGTGNGVADEREYETRRALQRGLARGIVDGAFDFETPRVRLVRVG